MLWITFGVEWLPNVLAPMLRPNMLIFFSPVQAGVGVSGGCEAAVHAARRFLDSMDEDRIFVKLDFANVFNCLHETTCWKPLGTLFQKSTVFASLLTATIPSYSSVISHSCRVLVHNKGIHWPVCYSAWLFKNFSGQLAPRLPPVIWMTSL